MTEAELVEQLLALPDLDARKHLLEVSIPLLNDEVIRLLKEQADHFLRVDIRRSFEISDIVNDIAQLTNNIIYKAMGFLIVANGRSIGKGEYSQAIKIYDEAAEIYRSEGRIAEHARSQVGKVYALSNLACFDEAIEIGKWVSPILEEYKLWLSLATLTMNLGIVYGRLGDDVESLAMFDRARELYTQLGFAEKTEYGLIQTNRAVPLRHMGKFDESIAASQKSIDVFGKLGESVEAARAKQGLALTFMILGKFNEALDLLDNVRDVFANDERPRDAMRVELYISDCLLQLRRFSDVLEKCKRIRGLFAELGTRQIEALAIINEAVAYAQLYQYEQALASLEEARQIFIETGNETYVASTDLEVSAVYLCQKRHAEGLALAQKCASVFNLYESPIEESQAFIVSARAALALEQSAEAQEFILRALQIGERLNVPTVKYQGYYLLGVLANSKGNVESAQEEFDRAIHEVEQLRGRLMVEFRVSFLEDKESIYEDIVDICIDQDQPLQALEYAERAKSRALLDMLAYRLDLTIQVKNSEDQPLVDKLTHLRAERDKLYRRWESDAENDEKNERGWSSSQSLRQKAQQDVITLEKEITDLWHKLLIHNADYARDASLYTVHTESAQPFLEEDVMLVEYFVVHGKLIVFLLTMDDVQVIRLDTNLKTIEILIQKLQLNLRSVPKSPVHNMTAITHNAQYVLAELYDALIAPMQAHLADYSKLIIVPHGPLHYLPFHALYDGFSYLLERHEIGYLPSASSLRYCKESRPQSDQGLAIGYSQNGRLPYAVDEAHHVATILGCHVLDEGQATTTKFRRIAPECHTLHLAAHGDFRFDNPLFSGLIFADGWLTTMDIFNLHLKASLVTLSACQTGRNVIGGGDELLGLMRAFLGAGAASVVLTLWSVEDRSTAQLMDIFYQKLTAGYTKSAALREAQLQFIHTSDKVSNEQARGDYAHPYFWAPFFLVGDIGIL